MGKTMVPADEYVSKTLKKRIVDQDVLTLAKERIHRAYELFDQILVSFSGGKDSTVMLNLTVDVARELGKLPVTAVFWDEEAIHPETIDYVNRVRQRDDIRLRWICVPVKHVNACSVSSPYWRPWDPTCPELWCRPMPDYPQVETELPNFKGEEIHHSLDCLCDRRKGTTGILIGLRANESLRRHMAVSRRELDNYISWSGDRTYAQVKVIYDFTTDDIWLATERFGWDYNRTYDLLDMFGVSRDAQRVAPPFGEQPMINLPWYAACFPDLWDTMSRRVPGAATAARYAGGELYGWKANPKIQGRTYQETIQIFLRRFPPDLRAHVAKRLQGEIEMHRQFTNGDTIPDEGGHPVSGLSWRLLAYIALRGDLKGRRRVLKEGLDDQRARLADQRAALAAVTPADPTEAAAWEAHAEEHDAEV